MSLEGPRLLHKMLDGAWINTASATGVSTFLADTGWTMLNLTNVLPPNGQQFAIQRTYWDLEGLSKSDLTTFATNLLVQEAWAPSGNSESAWIIELVTTERVSNAEILQALDTFSAPHFGTTGSQIGFSLSKMDQFQILYGRSRLYTTDSTITPIVPHLHSVNQFGIGAATAGSKLYITRIAYNYDEGTVFRVPECNFVLASVIGREKDNSYIQRLKLSYENSNKGT